MVGHHYKTWVEISEDALENNVKILRGVLARPVRGRSLQGDRSAAFGGAASNGVKLMAVVKANAYGHGLKEVVSVLKKEKGIMFGVDSLEEALIVKSVALKNEIMILGYIPEKNLSLAIKNGFHFSIYDKSVLQAVAWLVQTGKVNPRAIRAHLKTETGTNRLGIKPSELKNIKFEFPVIGVYTHLADSENLSSSFYKEQIERLNEAIGILKNKGVNPKFIHSACTATALRGGFLNGNLARIGIGLYGLWPSEELKEKFSKKIKLEPVLSWKTRIAQVRCVSEGETIGYDRTHKVKKETTIAILPVGYYDGYDRKLSGVGEVIINGKLAKIAGRVCMNIIMIDSGHIKAKAGDEVVLIGQQGREQITAEKLAKKIGTINYEIVSRINPLLPRF